MGTLAQISVASLSTVQFWRTLKSEAAAVSWNLRDAQRNGDVGTAKSSLSRALVSAERIVTLVDWHMEEFRKRMAERKGQR